MYYRELGRTGWKVSEVSFGAWAIGGNWGTVNDDDSLSALRQAIKMGVNFIDTADVYGDGRSEKLVAQVVKESEQRIYVATKAGRRLSPHTAEGYNRKNLNAYVDRSLRNLGVESIDLLQLHCPPVEVYYRPEIFDVLDDMVKAGKIKYYGVSVEKVEEALKAIEYPNVQTVQIIFNMFRQRPAELFFKEAKRRGVGILARVPLASGLLTGKMMENSTFETDDHRNFNRYGESFDQGETFSGIDFQRGLDTVDKLKKICPNDMNMVRFALSWILMFEEVTCAIPGAKTSDQANENFSVSDLPQLSMSKMDEVKSIYDNCIRPFVHHKW
jgi:aryl-alcohol dehydrogenase-like predicted oxidoreductase